MQPSYLPWLGYFDLILQSDLFLVYDNVQYDKDGWRNRNRIKTPKGLQWLTVPVLTTGLNKPTNRDIRISNHEHWQRKHLASLKMNYAKAACFGEVFPIIESVLSKPWDFLLDLNMRFLNDFCDYLGIRKNFKFASEVRVDLPEGKNEKLVAYCRHFQAEEFYEPAGGKGYIDPAMFESNGVRLTFQDYQHPGYPQLHGAFVPCLSTADLLLNCGKKSANAIRGESMDFQKGL
jgi:hypothetical protein